MLVGLRLVILSEAVFEDADYIIGIALNWLYIIMTRFLVRVASRALRKSTTSTAHCKPRIANWQSRRLVSYHALILIRYITL